MIGILVVVDRSRRAALAVAAAIALLAAAPLAGAHGEAVGAQHALQETRLCFAPANVAVHAEGEGMDAATERALAERIERGLRAALARADVPLREAPADARGCDPVRAELALERWRSERGMAVAYDLLLEVGRPERAPRFSVGAEAAFLEAETPTPWLVLLPRYSDAASRDLALSWWEDNPLRRGPPPWLRPLLGGALALVAAVAGARWAARRRRSGAA